MRLSAFRVAAACAVPVLVVTVVATAWAGWYADGGRNELARLGNQATLQSTNTQAISALSREIIALDWVGVLPDAHPKVLDPYIASSPVVRAANRGSAGTLLELSERSGARSLERLQLAGMSLRPSTVRALSQLDAGDRQRVTDGQMPANVSLADYADAAVELQGAFASMPTTTEQAVAQLVALGQTPPPWRQPSFIGVLLGLWAFAIVIALALGRMVARRLRRSADELSAESARMQALVRRNARLLELADANRRVSSRTDLKGIADAVAGEAATLLRAGAAAVYLVEGDRAVPVGASGDIQAREISCDAGILGRALDTGASARGVVDSDPALPGLSPVALLAAPLIAGHRVIGAIVVGRQGDALLDDDDAQALQLIALAAGTAIEGARAHDSATALALTGLGNRRRLDDDLARACAPGTPQPVGLAMIDVDHFKSYNDANGHPAGDDVLRRVAALAAANVREQDVVYRFGGEELCVILPGAGLEEVARVTERIRSAVAEHDFVGGASQPGGRVTVSAGVACDEEPGATVLMAAADAALYRAKREGRDRVVTAP